MRSNPCTPSMKNPPKRWPRTAVEKTGLLGLGDIEGALVSKGVIEYICIYILFVYSFVCLDIWAFVKVFVRMISSIGTTVRIYEGIILPGREFCRVKTPFK